jgi:hypothetical protein
MDDFFYFVIKQVLYLSKEKSFEKNVDWTFISTSLSNLKNHFCKCEEIYSLKHVALKFINNELSHIVLGKKIHIRNGESIIAVTQLR